MPTAQPPGKRPVRAPNTGNGGKRAPLNNKVEQAQKVKSKISVGEAAKFVFTPEIGRSFEGVKLAWNLLINFVAQVYVLVQLIPADHPCVDLKHASEYKLIDIIKIAYKGLKWRRDQIPQIIIFFAVLAFLFFITLSLITMALNLSINVAHAATNDQPQSADDVLNQIFDVQGTGMIPTALGAMLKAYSNIVLVLAGIILLYHIMQYVIETARHGQAGGKSFNHAWAPLRLVAALGLLVPLASGLNSGQYITLYLAKWGSDMATDVFKQFSNQIGLGQGITVSNVGVNTQAPLAKLFNLYVDAYKKNNEQPGSINIPTQMTPVVGKNNYYELVFDAGPNATSLGNQNGSGKIQFYYNPSATTDAEKLANQQWQFFSNNAADIRTLAQDVAAHLNPQDSTNYFQQIDTGAYKTSLQNLAKSYSDSLGTAYSDAVSSANSNLQAQMNQELQGIGWISAPIWFQRIGQINADMTEAYQGVPNVIANGQNLSDQISGDAIDQDHPPSASGGLGDWVLKKIQSLEDEPVQTLSSSTGGNWGARFYTWIINSSNPIGSVITIGHTIIDLATGMIAGWLVIVGMIGASGTELAGIKLGGGQEIVEALVPIVTGIIGLLFTNGYMLGILFPLIPVIRFIFAVLGWISMVLIAVMGMPLFALAHLKTGGEGWIGQLQVASAYNMIIGIIIRPTLIILGFILSIILFNNVIKIGSYVLLAATQEGVNGLGSAIVASPINLVTQPLIMFLFSSFTIAMANACFKMVEIVPSQAMTWMGTGPQSSPTEDGMGEITSASQGFASQFGQFTTGTAMPMASKRLYDAATAARQLKNGTSPETSPGAPTTPTPSTSTAGSSSSSSPITARPGGPNNAAQLPVNVTPGSGGPQGGSQASAISPSSTAVPAALPAPTGGTQASAVPTAGTSTTPVAPTSTGSPPPTPTGTQASGRTPSDDPSAPKSFAQRLGEGAMGNGLRNLVKQGQKGEDEAAGFADRMKGRFATLGLMAADLATGGVSSRMAAMGMTQTQAVKDKDGNIMKDKGGNVMTEQVPLEIKNAEWGGGLSGNSQVKADLNNPNDPMGKYDPEWRAIYGNR